MAVERTRSASAMASSCFIVHLVRLRRGEVHDVGRWLNAGNKGVGAVAVQFVRGGRNTTCHRGHENPLYHPSANNRAGVGHPTCLGNSDAQDRVWIEAVC